MAGTPNWKSKQSLVPSTGAAGTGVSGAAGAGGAARLMSVEQQRFANVIGVLNDKRALERVPFGLVTTMKETAKLLDDYNDVCVLLSGLFVVD